MGTNGAWVNSNLCPCCNRTSASLIVESSATVATTRSASVATKSSPPVAIEASAYEDPHLSGAGNLGSYEHGTQDKSGVHEIGGIERGCSPRSRLHYEDVMGGR